MDSNDKAGVVVAQPTTAEERTKVATTCCTALKMTMPLLVDTLDDRAGHAYSGMPDRLYVIDAAGRIAYKGGRGPFGFKAREMEQALILLLLEGQGRRVADFGFRGNTTTGSPSPPMSRGNGDED
jgi:hypothetical protein